MSKRAIRKVAKRNRRQGAKLARKFGYLKLAEELGKRPALGRAQHTRNEICSTEVFLRSRHYGYANADTAH